jgi:hypothetical protein
MQISRKKWGFVIVGAVAAVALGAIAVAGAATSQSASPAPSASGSASAQGRHAPDFDGDGPHGGLDGQRGGVRAGGPDMAEALAKLSGKDVSAIMRQREAGKTFKQIAEAYGVDTTRLVAEAVAIETAELDAAVKAGTLTDAQRTQEISGLQARFQQELTETGMKGHGGPGDGRGHGFGGGGDIPEALAKLSGKDASTIMQQRAAGKSFAQIAKAYGVSTDELLAETVRLEKAELEAAVKAGTLTGAQRTQILSDLQTRLKAELTETRAFGHGGHGFGDGSQGSAGSTQGGSTGTGYQSAPSTSGTMQTF